MLSSSTAQLPCRHRLRPYPTQYFDPKLLNDYLNSQQQSLSKNVHAAPTLPMTNAYSDYAPHPAMSSSSSLTTTTTTPQLLQAGFSQAPMPSTNPNHCGLESWHSYGNMPVQSLQTSAQCEFKGHQRASSSSSVGSSASQYRLAGTSPNYRTFSNHLPTPTHTPTQESLMNSSNFTNLTPSSTTVDQTMSAHMSMRQALIEQSDDVPDFVHSARQSISSHGRNSPVTPRTTHEDPDCKTSPESRPVPKFERTYTDIAADTFYDPRAVASTAAPNSKPAQSSLLSPYRSNTTENVQRALQAAQYARSHSPTRSASRGDSPFRRSSPYRQSNSNFNAQMIGSAAAAREHTRQADAAYAMKSQIQENEDVEVKTISPKDALLDYRENEGNSKASLFPDHGAHEYDGQNNGGDHFSNITQSSFTTSSPQAYQRKDWQSSQYPQSFSTASAPSLQRPIGFDFIAPSSVQPSVPALSLSATSQYRSTPNSISSIMEQTPEFPAHLTSMESSASEAEPPSGSQNSVLSDRYLAKPGLTGADSGTYSCTYHGCSQRFETPQKLQKHKREGHRSNTMTSAAILDRNSQAGPHKCERTNPTTGKPCNTIFSRPYDLTRHEDTIHNGRKQKVRCALCIEEKSFSRNDALTRHMRVVHPEVEFPGKHRRRGAYHD